MKEYRVYTQTEKSKSSHHKNNEDRCLFSEYRFMEDINIQVLLIADGMGGLSEGAKAAYRAVLGFSKAFYEKMADTYIDNNMDTFSMCYFADKMEEIVKESIKAANVEVCNTADSYLETGTTLSVVCIVNGYAIAANIGDSPIYLYRTKQRELKLISRLQTRAELDVEAGRYERYSSEYYANDHILYNSLGQYSKLDDEEIYCRIIGKLQKGDMFLLGSDGAFDQIQEEEIWKLLDGCKEDDEGFILTQLFDLACMEKNDDQTAILYVVGEGV